MVIPKRALIRSRYSYVSGSSLWVSQKKYSICGNFLCISIASAVLSFPPDKPRICLTSFSAITRLPFLFWKNSEQVLFVLDETPFQRVLQQALAESAHC